MQDASSPKSRKKKNIRSVLSLSDATPGLIVVSNSYTVIPRKPVSPAYTEPRSDVYIFELKSADMTRILTELEMIMKYINESNVWNLIYNVRFDELISMLQESRESENEYILHSKSQRLMFEGLQYGATLMTRTSIHFYPLINAIPKTPLFVSFRKICIAMKYEYLWKQVGVRIHCYDSKEPLILLFESSEARDDLFNYIKNKIKFKDPSEELPRMTEKWRIGTLSNTEYLVYLNNLSNRCNLDLTQYPVFPWVITNYTDRDLDITDINNFRDLKKHVGYLNPPRLQIYKEEAVEDGPNPDEDAGILSSHYLPSSTVSYYLMRKYPEIIIRQQNTTFGPIDRQLKSIESSWLSSYTAKGDNKELIPEFYLDSNFLRNSQDMNLGYREPVEDVKLPPWASDYAEFSTRMKEFLECDVVSENLNAWIDLIFGVDCKGVDREIPTFSHHCYGVEWEDVRSDVEMESLEVLVKEFGQCPKQIFFEKHPQRVFRQAGNEEIKSEETENLKVRIQELLKEVQSINEKHRLSIRNLNKQHKRATLEMSQQHKQKVDELKEVIQSLESASESQEETKDHERSKSSNIERALKHIKYKHEKELAKFISKQSSAQLLRQSDSGSKIKRYDSFKKLASEKEILNRKDSNPRILKESLSKLQKTETPYHRTPQQTSRKTKKVKSVTPPRRPVSAFEKIR
jgi:factor associated with neutral sphingomyelinase activation